MPCLIFLFGPFKLLMKNVSFIWISCFLFSLHWVHSQVPWTALDTLWVEVSGLLPNFSSCPVSPLVAQTRRHQVHHFATASNSSFQARNVGRALGEIIILTSAWVQTSPQPTSVPRWAGCFFLQQNRASGGHCLELTTSALLNVLGEDADVKIFGWGLI